MNVVFTRAGVARGMRRVAPLMFGIAPFAVVVGIVAQGKGLSLIESTLMNLLVFAGASQLVALAAWSHPAPVLAATLAAFVVNLRMALMGPALGQWLDRLRGVRLWGTLAIMVDHSFALSVADIRAGGADAGFLLGASLLMWVVWVAASVAGFLAGAALHLPPGHPLFFAALAAFIALLVPMWRGSHEAAPWLVAAVVASVVARALPGTAWYIVAGAAAGSLAGALRDRRRERSS